MIIKGLLVLLAVFCTLVALLVFAKSRPASADVMQPRHQIVISS